ncbi:Gfo/Idh/MocA family oxidoreductase [Brachybacterium tyrofermentans]|uniref:Gfo/Idh/MocA family oxidoreductase n=1 Tax=Brachybacterium tyrofermentans TaxID=47848 RepID=UPI003FD1BDB9
MPKTLNIAVIGAGTMAQAVHLPVLRRRWDRFAVTALVDHSPRRRRESSEVWGIGEEARYESVADLIAAVRAKSVSVDAVVLSTDGLHVDDLLQLMKRGLPILVEPPLGYSEDEIARVADFERMTGRRLVMMAYPQQYDDSVSRMAEQIATKDLRMVDHEVLMPASQPLFGGAHVTTSSYDLPSEVRAQRRTNLQAAVVAGSGDGATQRDRDLYVKGLLTGVAHQLAVLEAVYGPVARLVAVRHWPKGVIPGSLELLGELEGGAQVRLVWHYLPFAPEYSETIQVLSARRRMQVELPAPSHGDRRSTVSLREKKAGVVQETSTTAAKGSAELMWEAFHAFVEKGTLPYSGAAEAQTQVALLREVLSTIVVADGRSLEAEPTDDEDPAGEESTSEDSTSEDSTGEDSTGKDSAGDGSTDGEAADGADGTAADGSGSTPDSSPMMVTAPAAVGVAAGGIDGTAASDGTDGLDGTDGVNGNGMAEDAEPSHRAGVAEQSHRADDAEPSHRADVVADTTAAPASDATPAADAGAQSAHEPARDVESQLLPADPVVNAWVVPARQNGDATEGPDPETPGDRPEGPARP